MNTFTRTTSTRAQVDNNRRLSFYASVFDVPAPIQERDNSGNVIRYTEVIKPGAFAAALNSDSEVIANIDHDATQTFARRSTGDLLLAEDPHGLFATCYLPSTPEGDRIIERVSKGELDGCSFRFSAIKDRQQGDTIERLEVKLIDVCLTAHPAYQGTEVHLRNNIKLKSLISKFRLLKIKSRMLNTQ